MKTIATQKDIYFIGKLDEVLAYLREMEKKYSSVQELINIHLN